jgi:2-dehydropantoate 2-reductase
MNVVVMGAGAVGATFGARLAEAGHRVSFVARGDHLHALRRDGLRLRSTLGDVHLHPVTALAEPGEAGEADLVLFTVKAQDSEEAVRRIAPIVGPATRVLTLQNGIDGVETLRRAFGDERVFGGVAYIEAVIVSPGEVVHKSPFARIVFGPLSGAADPRADATLEAFEEAGVEASLEADPMVAVWRKWLLICAFSGMTALTRKPIGPIVERAETRRLLRAAMQEIADLAAARGVALPEDAVDAAMELVTRSFEPTMTSSLAQDLAAGKPLELEALNGAASRWGRDLGVPTPVNDFIYAALVLHAAGEA